MKNYSHSRKDLAAFFKSKGNRTYTAKQLARMFGASRFKDDEEQKGLPYYFGFQRTKFGIIHIRTDGERVLVFTHSGKAGLNEAYRFTVDKDHHVKFAKKVKKH